MNPEEHMRIRDPELVLSPRTKKVLLSHPRTTPSLRKAIEEEAEVYESDTPVGDNPCDRSDRGGTESR